MGDLRISSRRDPATGVWSVDVSRTELGADGVTSVAFTVDYDETSDTGFIYDHYSGRLAVA
jgi:hypothetical protein